MAGWVLAIDFGTSYTTVAIAEDGRVEMIDVDGVRAMPSGVWHDGAGGLVVGAAAERQARLAPERWERAPKRLLGEVAPMLLGGHEVPVVEAVAAVLRHAAAEAMRRQGSAPDEVRLTCPARWGERRRGGLQTAAGIAGLGAPVVIGPPRLVPEPVAAALYFADRGVLPAGSQVAVYDLGGGTFDTAVLAADGQGFSVRALGGLDGTGGESFDALLYSYIGEQLARRDPDVWESLRSPADSGWRRAGEDLYREVRRAKEDLSKYAAATLDTEALLGVSLQLTRDELESVLRPRIEATARELADTIQRTGQRPDQLAGVYLAGGASRMPLVERVVSDTLQVTARVLGEPKSVVAAGAARWSADVRVAVVLPSAQQVPAAGFTATEAPTRIVVGAPVFPQQRSNPPEPTELTHPAQPAYAPPPPSYPTRPTYPTQPTYPMTPPPYIPDLPSGEPRTSTYEPTRIADQRPLRRPRRWWRHPVTIISVVFVLLAGVGATIFWLTRDEPRTPRLAAPANFTATANRDAVNLSWSAVPKAARYVVYRDSSVISSTGTSTTFVDRPGDTDVHSYEVNAVDSGGRVGATSVTATAKAGTVLSSAEQTLLNRLPDGLVDPDTCKPKPENEDVYTVAAIECDPGSGATSATPPAVAPTVITAYQDRTADLFRQDLEKAYGGIATSRVNCAYPPARLEWFYTATRSIKEGQSFCLVGQDGDPAFVWTYKKDFIAISVRVKGGSEADVEGLHQWWRNAPKRLRTA